MTVFVQAMGAKGSDFNISKASIENIREQLVAKLKQRMPSLNMADFVEIERGKLVVAFPETKASDVKSGEIARIVGDMTIIQVLEKELLIQVDGVKFFLAINEGAGAELGAKLGDQLVRGVPMDGLYYVGKPTSYTTVVGRQSFAFPLVSIVGLADDQSIKSLIASERKRRDERYEKVNQERIQGEMARRLKEREVARKRYLEKIQRTFTDISGKHSVEAAAIKFDGKAVDLIRLSDKHKISIPAEKLSVEDQRWLENSKTDIEFYGVRLDRLYSTEVAPLSKPVVKRIPGVGTAK